MKEFRDVQNDLEDIKSGRKFYIEDREYNRIFSTLPSLAKHSVSTGFCTMTNTQVTENKNNI